MTQIDWRVKNSVYGAKDFKDASGKWVPSFRSASGSVNTQNHTRSGYLWFDLLKRTKAGGRFQQKNPTYEGVKLGFEGYQEFAEWAVSQVGYGCIDLNGRSFHLDKDILFQGNKIYSPDRCIFIPASLNSILNISQRARGILPIGVSLDRGAMFYRARAKRSGSTIGLGKFSCASEAHTAWQLFKAKCISDAAEEYLRNEWSRFDVYKALMDRADRLLDDANNGIQTTCI